MMKNNIILIIMITSITFGQTININGDLSETNYQVIATKQNSNSGFGSSIDIKKIVYYPDFTNSFLYLGVESNLNTGNSDGIGILLNVTGTGSPTGRAAGKTLGGGGGYHFLGSAGNPNYKADFEVDYMFAFNPGGSASTVYFDAAKWVGDVKSLHYQGSCNQSGLSVANSNADGTVFTNNSVTFAFNNSGSANNGLEMKIPFSEIAAASDMSIEVFTFLVSNNAYFSDVTIPGNIAGGNLGYNPDFGSVSGGPFHPGAQSLPVELSSFSASVASSCVKLNWKTETEVNNYGFEIEREIGSGQSAVGKWGMIGFVSGHGNSNSPKEYSFIDENVLSGAYSYRLKQIDNDGSYEFSKTIEIDIDTRTGFELSQNYPNPFNPTTTIKFNLPESEVVKIVVYDILGTVVKTLVDEFKEAGIHTINFDASEFASGTYVYRIETSNFVEIKKMLLIK